MKKLIIYAGSFRPFHIGHLNITEKIEKIFGKEDVLIAIGVNPSKISVGEDIIQRGEELSKRIGRKVEVYTSFLHEFIEEKESQGYEVTLVRGLRNGDDLSYENNQLSFIFDFKPNINVVFIMCDKKFEHISSSSIKILESFKEGSGSKYVV